MWRFFSTLILLFASGTFSVEGKPPIIRQGLPAASEPQISTTPEWGTITQKVDHFNAADNRTWEMRYIRNNAFYEEGGPIIVFIGGEWTISIDWTMSGLFFDIARLHNASLLYTEHRFYGNSFPTSDLSSDSFKYFSVDQALADLAYFIEYQKRNMTGLRNSTVIVTGASYAGTLATWARIKYPHIIDIAYCSSGGVFAEADFTGYYEVVEENLRLASPSCSRLVRRAMVEVMEMLETQEGANNVSQLFNTCEVVNASVEIDKAYFLQNIPFNLGSVVQYAQPGDPAAVCRYIENQTGSDMEKLAKYVRVTSECLPSYSDDVKTLSTTALNTTDMRQWMYQMCTQFGWFQTRAFGDTYTIEMYYQMCMDLFGKEYNSYTIDSGVERTNLFYGGYKPDVTRLITCHGTVDPWSRVGLQEDLNEYAITIIINGTSHSAELGAISDSDSDVLKQAKSRVVNIISDWLSELKGHGK